jgi:large subunit ribosomal protein L25
MLRLRTGASRVVHPRARTPPCRPTSENEGRFPDMSRETLVAEKRDASGKSPVARRLRKTGKVPGVLYRHGEASVPFAAEDLAVAAVLRHGANMVDLELGDSRHLTVLKDYQVHPVRGTVQHLDLQEVRAGELVRLAVAAVAVGDAPGVKSGGVLTQNTHEITIDCTPDHIPDAVEFDISALEGGQSLHLSAVTAPEGVTFLDPGETLLVSITVPRGAKGAAAAAAADEAAAGDGDAAADGAAE